MDRNKDGWCVSTSSHCLKIEAKYLRSEVCRLARSLQISSLVVEPPQGFHQSWAGHSCQSGFAHFYCIKYQLRCSGFIHLNKHSSRTSVKEMLLSAPGDILLLTSANVSVTVSVLSAKHSGLIHKHISIFSHALLRSQRDVATFVSIDMKGWHCR